MPSFESDPFLDAALPFARACGDLTSFVSQASLAARDSGEPVFFLTTKKDPAKPSRFPVALQLFGFDEVEGAALLISEMPIIRPDYDAEGSTVRGNHVVVALLREVMIALESDLGEGFEVLTSSARWREITRDRLAYCARKQQRAMSIALEESGSAAPPAPSPRRRL